VVEFIDDMARRYAEADLIICRAGASTIAELAAAGVASVLVPYPHAVDDHQTGNARFLAGRGAALLVPQVEFTARRLSEILAGFTRERLLEMARSARAAGKPEATRAVAEVCMQLAG
jgi:UDP-N-acetylglucosamine--N-acetylmuramyl-(pentapeptide) pyrophosphoryl-undecaprenol N-acetylglucosamine transferase